MERSLEAEIVRRSEADKAVVMKFDAEMKVNELSGCRGCDLYARHSTLFAAQPEIGSSGLWLFRAAAAPA